MLRRWRGGERGGLFSQAEGGAWSGNPRRAPREGGAGAAERPLRPREVRLAPLHAHEPPVVPEGNQGNQAHVEPHNELRIPEEGEDVVDEVALEVLAHEDVEAAVDLGARGDGPGGGVADEGRGVQRRPGGLRGRVGGCFAAV